MRPAPFWVDLSQRGACGQTLRTFKDKNIRRSGTLDTNIKLFTDIASLKGKWNVHSEVVIFTSTETLSLKS